MSEDGAQTRSAFEYEIAVASAEETLDHLGDALRPSIVEVDTVAAWSLLARARSLFTSVRWLADGPSDAAVWIVLRTSADLSILVAWLRIDPGLHVRLWTVESWRRE